MAALRQIVNGNVTDASDVNQYSTLFGKVGSTVSSLVYDVVNGYGADPTGSADATTAIQSAITDACTANNGGVVYIPAGVYKITATLNVTAPCITVTGDGPGSGEVGKGTVLKVFTAFTGTSVIKFAPNPWTQPLGGCTLRNISINGNTNAGTNIDGVVFSVYEGRIDTVNVEYMSGVGIRVIGVVSPSWTTYDTRLTNIVASRCTSHGVFFDVKSTDAWLIDGSIFYNGGDGVYVTASAVHVHGIHTYSNQHGVHLFQVSRATIQQGYHENNLLAGVYIDGSTSVRVVGNSIFGNGRAVTNTWSNLTIANTTGSSAVIVGNVFDTDPVNVPVPKWAIDLPSAQAQNCIVEGNQIFGTYFNTRPVHDNGSGGYNGTLAATATTACLITNNPGFNPVGEVVAAGLSTPGIPTTGSATVPNNCFNEPATVYLTAGTGAVTVGIAQGNSTTVTAMIIPANGVGSFRVMPGQAVTLTYTGSPSWKWFLD